MTEKECARTRPVENPHEIWKTPDGTWEWRILKKWQENDEEPYARWYCAVKSPMTYGKYEIGDVYVKEIKRYAIKQQEETKKNEGGWRWKQ